MKRAIPIMLLALLLTVVVTGNAAAEGCNSFGLSNTVDLAGQPADANMAQLDDDAMLEAVFSPTQSGTVYAYDHDGTVLWTFVTGWYGQVDAADANGDGYDEVVVSSADGNVYYLDHEGIQLWSYSIRRLAHGKPRFCQLDADAELEIVACEWDSSTSSVNTAYTYALDPEGQQLLWEYPTPDDCVPVAKDLDGDGLDEVIVGTRGDPAGGHVILLSNTGTALWDVPVTYSPWEYMDAYDYDSDGYLDPVVDQQGPIVLDYDDGHELASDTSHGHLRGLGEYAGAAIRVYTGSDDTFYALDAGLGEQWSHLMPAGNTSARGHVHDTDGDGEDEVIVAPWYGDRFWIFDKNGTELFGAELPAGNGGHPRTPWSVGDFSGDGLADLIIGDNTAHAYYYAQECDDVCPDPDSDGFVVCDGCTPAPGDECGDCDDTDPEVNPDAAEYCDEVDNDCDGATDESDAVDAATWYEDADSDGYGDAGSTLTACTQPPGYSGDADDCDDANATIHPGATEICGNGIDEDCDGVDPPCPTGEDLIVDFGDGAGLWVYYDASDWGMLHNGDAGAMAVGDLDGDGVGELVADFGSGPGIQVHGGAGWQPFLHPELMATGDLDGNGQEELIVDLGTGGGIGIYVYYNNSVGERLDENSPEGCVTGDLDGNGKDEMIVHYGAAEGGGIEIYYNDSSWERLHSLSPESIATGDLDGNGRSELIVDFGPGVGIYIFWNDETWSRLHASSPEAIATGDLDGNGRDDVIVDFGSGAGQGIYVFFNNTSWVRLHSRSPEMLAAADLDATGSDELIVDFGSGAGLGVYVYWNNTSWTRLHATSPESFITGDLGSLTKEGRSAKVLALEPSGRGVVMAPPELGAAPSIEDRTRRPVPEAARP